MKTAWDEKLKSASVSEGQPAWTTGDTVSVWSTRHVLSYSMSASKADQLTMAALVLATVALVSVTGCQSKCISISSAQAALWANTVNLNL